MEGCGRYMYQDVHWKPSCRNLFSHSIINIQGSNSGLQAWGQVPLPTQPSYQPKEAPLQFMILSVRGGALCHFTFCRLRFCLVWSCVYLLHAIMDSVYQRCWVWVMLFPWSHPPLLALKVFIPPLPHRPWDLGMREIKTFCLGMRVPTFLCLSVELWLSVLIPFLLQEATTLMRAEWLADLKLVFSDGLSLSISTALYVGAVGQHKMNSMVCVCVVLVCFLYLVGMMWMDILLYMCCFMVDE